MDGVPPCRRLPLGVGVLYGASMGFGHEGADSLTAGEVREGVAVLTAAIDRVSSRAYIDGVTAAGGGEPELLIRRLSAGLAVGPSLLEALKAGDRPSPTEVTDFRTGVAAGRTALHEVVAMEPTPTEVAQPAARAAEERPRRSRRSGFFPLGPRASSVFAAVVVVGGTLALGAVLPTEDKGSGTVKSSGAPDIRPTGLTNAAEIQEVREAVALVFDTTDSTEYLARNCRENEPSRLEECVAETQGVVIGDVTRTAVRRLEDLAERVGPVCEEAIRTALDYRDDDFALGLVGLDVTCADAGE